jgi:uncharacterized protein
MSTWQKDIRVPLPDGAWLAGDLSVPEGEGPWPAILIQSPYGKERLGSALPRPSARTWLDFWDRDRYALLIVDWRGFHKSAGAGAERKASHRGEDGVAVVEWMAAQPWCNERVAAWGPSALGRAVLRTAAEQPLPLVCGIPLVCHMGHFYEDLYEGGVLEEAHFNAIRALGFRLSDSISSEVYSGTEFWREGEAECRPEDIDIPLLLVTGWFDLVTAQTLRFFTDLQTRGGPRARAYSRLLIGPWHHTAIDHRRQGGLTFPAAVGEGAKAMRLFLDHWVRRKQDQGWSELTGVTWWQMGEERWVSAPAWPPPTTERVLNLGADGALTDDPPAVGTLAVTADPENPVPTLGGANLPMGLRAGPVDQRPIEERDDVLLFTTAELEAPVALTGAACVTLTVVTDAIDCDLAVRLTDVHPDGKSFLLGDSIRRAKLRGSTARPMPITPGLPFEITVTLPPLAQTFLPGHRIRVLVAGSNHPRYERNPHTGADHFDDGEAFPARIELRFGEGSTATLRLPVSG